MRTDCCVVGAGPAGLMLALLLARRGVRVTLLEAHRDFEREFRGNTLNPSVMESLESIGLAGRILDLEHSKVRSFVLQTGERPRETFADFSRLGGSYPYVLMLPQVRFLEFIAAEAGRYPNFRLEMGSRVRALIHEGDRIVGVRYSGAGGTGEVRAGFVVGADGRFSRMRKLAGLEAISTSPPMDVYWFNLPREAGDPEDAGAVFRFGRGGLLVLMDHSQYWQAGYIIKKGDYARLKEEGLPALWRSVAGMAPELAGRVETLTEWSQGSLLSVESDRLRRWHLPGLLLIGDAAHVMSPVGGVGINVAIQDAVTASNVLGSPLLRGEVRERHLRAVQRKRELDVRWIQGAQSLAQRRVVANALSSSEPYELPLFLRLALRMPVLRDVPARLIAHGLRPERPKESWDGAEGDVRGSRWGRAVL